MTWITSRYHALGWRLGILLIPLFFGLSACQTSPPTPPKLYSSVPVVDPSQKSTYLNQTETLQKLYQQYKTWHGTPYRLGGNTPKGIDCSGFVQITFRDQFGIDLPRTTSEQVSMGRRIRKSDLQPGDLIFFRKGGHVGIYLEEDKFLHASTRLGVTISSLDNTYWSRYYWRAVSVRTHNNLP